MFSKFNTMLNFTCKSSGKKKWSKLNEKRKILSQPSFLYCNYCIEELKEAGFVLQVRKHQIYVDKIFQFIR